MADRQEQEGRLDAWRQNAREGLQTAARVFRREFSDIEKRLARAKEESAARAEDFRGRLLAPIPPSEEEFRARLVILEMEYEGRARAAEQGLALLADSFERSLERLARWADDLCARLGGRAPAMPAAPSLSEGPAPSGESVSLQLLLKGVLDALANRPARAEESAPRPRERDEAVRKLEKRVAELGRKLQEKDEELAALRHERRPPAAPKEGRRPKREDPPAIPLPPPTAGAPADDPRLERALAALDAEKETLEKLLKAVDARVARAAPTAAVPAATWPAEREELIDQAAAAQRELSTLRSEYEQSKQAWEKILAKHDEVRLKEIFQLKEELRAFKGEGR